MAYYPCYKCTERVLGCHSTCDNYLEFKKINDVNKKRRYEHEALDIVVENGKYRRSTTRIRNNKLFSTH